MWIGVLTVLSGPLLLINPLFIGWLQERHDVADRLQLSQEELAGSTGKSCGTSSPGASSTSTFDDRDPVLDADERLAHGRCQPPGPILVILDAVAIAFAAWGGRLLRADPDRLGRLLIAGAGHGGVATVAIGVFAVVAWESAFTLFHELLFPPGSWSFPPTSTMIRFYPPEFWFDAAMIAGGPGPRHVRYPVLRRVASSARREDSRGDHPRGGSRPACWPWHRRRGSRSCP